MEEHEFMREMAVLEACKKMSKDQRASRKDRWSGLWEILREYSSETLHEACKNLISGGDGFLPPSDEIIEACEEVEEMHSRKQAEPAPKFPLFTHTCYGKDIPPSRTVNAIRLMNQYEAIHLCCAGDIMATCPKCGVRHTERGVFAAVSAYWKDAPEDMNDCLKGYQLCAGCEDAKTKRGR